MDFELPEELRMMKDTLRRFIDNEVIPIEREAYDGHLMVPEVREKLEARARELGIWMIDIPEEYGGMGLGLLARVLVWEETGRTIAFPRRKPWIFGPDVSPILLQFLRDDQKDDYLWPCIRGEKYAAFCQTEPDAGGDPASMRTAAVREGGEYVINGMKRFVTGGDQADFAQVVCVTDREKGARGGISCILVDMDTPGVEVIRQQETMMDDRPCEVGFHDVRVPVENLIGNEGDGFRMAQNWITFGRMRHGSLGVGTMERCLELGASYAKQRVTFGEPLANRQAVQWMLVDTYAQLHQLRLMVYDAAARFDRGEDIRYQSYMCKYIGDRSGFEAADRCLQIHGGIGLTTDLPIEKLWRDLRSFMITEGPEEILKMALARHVLREYG
ncbi:MAG: acyl-CoA/acyl-ACP dehydrogenase [Defluviicoccus sp.]|nr:acyl-CoA/acyl-ACP dehydrogenase [Defluviicoccus sp.]MDE0276836.1 acyl-CoA/acyl-ACP dehydrogenase [Defluviicoccus sp.]